MMEMTSCDAVMRLMRCPTTAQAPTERQSQHQPRSFSGVLLYLPLLNDLPLLLVPKSISNSSTSSREVDSGVIQNTLVVRYDES